MGVAQYFKFFFVSSLPRHCQQLFAKFCWFYLLSTSNFHHFISISTASILLISFPIFQDIAKCHEWSLYTPLLLIHCISKVWFSHFLWNQHFVSSFFLFQIFEIHKLLTKTIFSFHSLQNHKDLKKYLFLGFYLFIYIFFTSTISWQY